MLECVIFFSDNRMIREVGELPNWPVQIFLSPRPVSCNWCPLINAACACAFGLMHILCVFFWMKMSLREKIILQLLPKLWAKVRQPLGKSSRPLLLFISERTESKLRLSGALWQKSRKPALQTICWCLLCFVSFFSSCCSFLPRPSCVVSFRIHPGQAHSRFTATSPALHSSLAVAISAAGYIFDMTSPSIF